MNDLVLYRLKSPSGLIANAKTYSLHVKNNRCYLLLLGRAMNKMPDTGNSLSQKMAENWVEKFAGRLALKLKEQENYYASMGLEEAAKIKGNLSFELTDIEKVKYSFPKHDPWLRIKVKGKKFKFEPGFADRSCMREFVNRVEALKA